MRAWTSWPKPCANAWLNAPPEVRGAAALLAVLLKAAAGGALLAALLLAVARIWSGGQRPPAGVAADLLLAIPLQRWGEIGLLGAALAAGAFLLGRLLPGNFGQALHGGFWAGLLAMIFVQQSATFLIHHLARAWPDQGFALRPLPGWWGMPELVALALAGGMAGILLAFLLRLSPVPDLPAGIAAGTFGLSQLAGELPLPALATAAPGWWVNLAINGGWGLGAALLMRPLVRRVPDEEPDSEE
jgi:hypothetical protein